MPNIYIINEESGQWEDYRSYPMLAFNNKSDAEKYLALIKEESDRLHLLAQEINDKEQEYYNSLGDNEAADDNICNGFKDELFNLKHKYLDLHRPDCYEQYSYSISEVKLFKK